MATITENVSNYFLSCTTEQHTQGWAQWDANKGAAVPATFTETKTHLAQVQVTREVEMAGGRVDLTRVIGVDFTKGWRRGQ